jgi:hypothetical protein
MKAQRHVLPPGQRMAAMAAVGAGLDDALARRPAAKAVVQGAAAGQPQQARKDRSENPNRRRSWVCGSRCPVLKIYGCDGGGAPADGENEEEAGDVVHAMFIEVSACRMLHFPLEGFHGK